jgi:LPXTG-site transpeptidase (sortase) family protein
LIETAKGKFNKPAALALALLMAATLVLAQPITMYAVPPYGFGGGQQAVHFNEAGVAATSREHFAVGEFSATTSSIYHYGDFLGTLHVERLNRTVRIYGGATMEAMDFGAGHFSFTGLNHGNTGLVGHNRGRTNGFFSFVRHLREGDIITLNANGITRNYALTMLYTINETDFSPLMEFNDNRLTLITCVEYVPQKRRVAVLLEIV